MLELNASMVEAVEEERLWKIEDVMTYLDCKKVTVWRYMHYHGLPYIKVTRTSPLRFRSEAVKEWIKAQETVEFRGAVN